MHDRFTPRFAISIAAMVVGLPAVPRAQLLTIPEALARYGESLGSGPSVPSGPAPTLDQVLKLTDRVVRGIVGEPKSYLSDDQRDVYTDYPIRNPVFLDEPTLAASERAEIPTVIVTLLGGTIYSNGLRFNSMHQALPLFEPGSECLLLVKQVKDQYFVAGRYYGAFRVTNGRLVRLTTKDGFAPDLQNTVVTAATDQILNRLRSLRSIR